MTTIAYRDGVLAADGRATSESGRIISDREVKIGTLPDGSLYACTGGYAACASLVDWLRGGEIGSRPALKDATVIRVLRNGRLRVYQDAGSYVEQARFVAFGTGAPYAFTAMQLGKDAIAAVRVACKIDVWSGGKVRWLVLPGWPRVPAKRKR